MSRGNRSIFFFNPFTKEEIDLPDIPWPERYLFNGICITSSPTDKDWMVFVIFSYPDLQYLIFMRCGEEKWTYLKIKIDLDFEPSNYNPVFYNGVFYCLAHDGKLGVFDPNGEILWRVLHQPQPPFVDMVNESYLVECGGQLLSVFLNNHGEMVSLYKLDELQMSWKTEKDLGDMILFSSHCLSFVVNDEVDGMANKIYFPRFYERGDGIVFYSLETRMFQTFGKKFSSKNLYGTTKKLHCCWIIPSSK